MEHTAAGETCWKQGRQIDEPMQSDGENSDLNTQGVIN